MKYYNDYKTVFNIKKKDIHAKYISGVLPYSLMITKIG